MAEAPRRPRREAPETHEARRGARPLLNAEASNLEVISSIVVKVAGIDIKYCPVGAGSTPEPGFQFLIEFFFGLSN